MTDPTRTLRTLTIATAIAGAVLFGCGPADGDDAGDDADLATATASSQQVASAVQQGGELARLMIPLETNAALFGLSPPEAVARKIADATQAFRNLVADAGCITASTDGTTYLTVTFTGCRIGAFLTLEGTFTGMLAVEQGTPNVLALTLDVPGVTLTAPGHTYHLEGSWALRQEIVIGTTPPVMFDGDVDFQIDGNPTLSMQASAEWVTSLSGSTACATLTGGAQLTGQALGAAAPIALSAQNVYRCQDRCPERGDVELSYGAGKLLTWGYDGDASVLVTGPRGREFEVTLPCGTD